MTQVQAGPAVRADGRGPAARPRRQLLADWVVQRGVLLALVTAPLASLFLGLLRVMPPRMGYLYLLLASIALPAFVAWRRARSTDPDEPAQHFHRYALYSLVPVAVFSLVRIPALSLTRFVFWMPWYGFGVGATGQPPGTIGSLLPGAMLYLLQGWSLGMVYYVLFKRHTLLNAMLLYTGFISSLYSFIFPVFIMVGLPATPVFHLTNYWAHTWMGLTAWFMPRFWQRTWPRLARPARAGAIAGLALVFAAPFTYVLATANLWQFGTQAHIEATAFNRVQASLSGSPAVSVQSGQAQYAYVLVLGPRAYRNYGGAYRAIDATAVQVRGQLSRGQQVIAWCAGDVDALPSVRTVRDPQRFFAALGSVNYTQVSVRCAGPAAGIGPGQVINVNWTAQLLLQGERSTDQRTLTGEQPARLTAGTPASTAPVPVNPDQ
jgi:hypothetical protein